MMLIKRLINFYYKHIKSPKDYAKYRGISFGENCFIATTNWPSEPYLIKIGNNATITAGVYFHTHGGVSVTWDKIPDFDVFGKIEIKDNAYIGTNAQIMPGVTIGKNSLIAAGSIVTHSVPDNEVWGGNPAKFICKVDDYINKNLKYNTHTKGKSFEEKKRILLSLPDSKFIKK